MPSPGTPQLQFYFDFISPYAYLAWTQVHALAARHGREVQAIPVLFAALLDANGQKGPAEIPRKRVYVFKDALRHAHALGVPLQPPPGHPFNPLLGLRLASLDLPSATQRALIDALFAATWGGGEGITDPEVVRGLLTAVGLDADRSLEAAATPAIKDRVRAQTEAALAAGAFGVPSLVADGELFWGLDSFGHLERFLAGQDPLDMAALAAGWGGLPAQSIRPGSTR
jgi:2-hydroxychromene-2-carboxylate isomerase